MFKINLQVRISLRQTNIRVQYLSTIASVDFEFSENVDLTHFPRKLRIFLKVFLGFLLN